MDDSNSELAEIQIDRQLRELHGRIDRLSNSQGVGDREPARVRLYDTLVVAATVALVGAAWVLGRSVAVLQASDVYQNERITELRGDVKQLQGTTFRGVDGFDKKEPARGN